MRGFSLCAVIPTFNHHLALPKILAALVEKEVPVIVVDDGSDPAEARRIAEVCGLYASVECLRHEYNGGKGFAVLRGLARADERDFTHAIQVDGDGQHDLAALPSLIQCAHEHPAALVLGEPSYDETAPTARRLGRWLTTFWVCVNSFSLKIPDTMCGFRVYPVEATLKLARREIVARRMDFDVEVIVHWHWQGGAIVGIPVRVVYPADNSSNFDLVRDNLLISAMHTRLFFGMLVRFPRLLGRQLFGRCEPALSSSQPRGEASAHWSELNGRGAYWGLKILAFIYRLLGRKACAGVMYPVVSYFFLTGRTQRRASLAYLDRAWRAGLLDRKPTLGLSFKHFQTFGTAALDKFASWIGHISRNELEDCSEGLFAATKADRRGAFVITTHLGNPEIMRALASARQEICVNILVHTIHAQRFTQLVEKVSPQSRVNVIQVSRVGPETMIILSEAIERGEWVVMTGDRISVREQGERVVYVPFLGEPAPFPQGPFILASVLRCPTYLLFCLRKDGRHRIYFRKFSDQVILPRRHRIEAIGAVAADFVKALELHLAIDPFQWFNFYDFWNPMGLAAQSGTTLKHAQSDA